ncbi:hypothetical protein P154DRAFT_579525 [Amniculicola lignicola CBS 123094]|uniref:Uncharacterized protein n=1 Tax=Amniculicola lignicola CBS 123094 TaxID=1392246 RepID=A0A6A5W4V0_9PLEO|nr:hypothetical protein P154DRAFT_579525 [Amniculicola lignicola CBS 123094]
MKPLFSILPFLLLLLLLTPSITAIENDCSMADTTPCDCTFTTPPTDLNYPNRTFILPGTDCRVCRVVGQLNCVLWGSSGTRYGPLCEDSTNTFPAKCISNWKPKVHDRLPCPVPAGDCHCKHINSTGTFTLPHEDTLEGADFCTVCPRGDELWCTEAGNKRNGYGPLCSGGRLRPTCEGKGCYCNWMTSLTGSSWRKE